MLCGWLHSSVVWLVVNIMPPTLSSTRSELEGGAPRFEQDGQRLSTAAATAASRLFDGEGSPFMLSCLLGAVAQQPSTRATGWVSLGAAAAAVRASHKAASLSLWC